MKPAVKPPRLPVPCAPLAFDPRIRGDQVGLGLVKKRSIRAVGSYQSQPVPPAPPSSVFQNVSSGGASGSSGCLAMFFYGDFCLQYFVEEFFSSICLPCSDAIAGLMPLLSSMMGKAAPGVPGPRAKLRC